MKGRRRNLRGSAILVPAVSTAVLLAGFAGSASAQKSALTKAPKSHTLNMSLLNPLVAAGLDPDVYYADEGQNLISAAYDTLLQYKPNTSTPVIEPDLAKSWTVSNHSLTYTFHLQPGVKFADGSAFNSTAVKIDFARRAAVDAGPAYMVADVKSVSTPSPLVAVVHLKTPNNAFLSELASEYGPRAISPEAIKEHAGTDDAHTWFTTHTDGTGAYTVSDDDNGTLYKLSYDPKSWEAKPYYTTINFHVTPSITTQELELEKGQLDLIEHAIPSSADQSLASSSGIKIYHFPTTEQELVYLNPNNGVLSSADVRKAILESINKRSIVDTVWPGQATVATQMYPFGEVPAGTAKENPPTNPGALTALKGQFGSQPIVIDYGASDPVQEQVADLLQAEFSAAGITSSAVGVPQAEFHDLDTTNKPTSPSILIAGSWPDADQPYLQAQIVYAPGGGINFFNCQSPDGTAELQKAVKDTNKVTAAALYVQAGDDYAATSCWDPIANNEDTMAAPSWLEGLTHDVAAPFVLELRYLHPSGA
jgi:peptide/nickel transport system substrate-binding protein